MSKNKWFYVNKWFHDRVNCSMNLPHSWPVALKASGGTPLTRRGKPFLFCSTNIYSIFCTSIGCCKSMFQYSQSHDSLRTHSPAKIVSYLPKHLHCDNLHKWACHPLCWFPSSGHNCELSAIAVGIKTAGQWNYLSESKKHELVWELLASQKMLKKL